MRPLEEWRQWGVGQWGAFLAPAVFYGLIELARVLGGAYLW